MTATIINNCYIETNEQLSFQFASSTERFDPDLFNTDIIVILRTQLLPLMNAKTALPKFNPNLCVHYCQTLQTTIHAYICLSGFVCMQSTNRLQEQFQFVRKFIFAELLLSIQLSYFINAYTYIYQVCVSLYSQIHVPTIYLVLTSSEVDRERCCR